MEAYSGCDGLKAAPEQTGKTSGAEILVVDSLKEREEEKDGNTAHKSAHSPEDGIDDRRRERLLDDYGKLPLSFIENKGQLDAKVKLYEKGSGHSTFFTEEGVFLSLTKSPAKSETKEGLEDEKKEVASLLVKLSPVGGNKNPEIVAEGLQEGKLNYFIGNDPEKWKTDVPAYGAVVYKEVYKGIDLKFYGNNRQLEYDVIVKPGADPSKVRLSYEGIEGLEVREDGALEISLKEGRSLYQKSPYIYQEIDGKRIVVDGAFKLLAEERPGKEPGRFVYSFEVASYDKSRPLIIDPIFVYSTYLGGSSEDYGRGIAVDSAGNAYVAGYTISNDFPLASPIDGLFQGYSEVFVTKINAAGSAVIYSTYLGGGSNDYGNGIAVDSAGNAYVIGYTFSNSFPMASPIDAVYQGYSEAFLTKINASGSALIYSTYLGGLGEDVAQGIAVDNSNNAYVTGYTKSTDFPLASPVDGTFQGLYEAYVTKVNAAGSALIYSTYLGGADIDLGHSIAVDSFGNAYVTGETKSTDFPLVSPVDGTFQGIYEAFVTKINAAGSALIYSTYLGGSGDDVGYGVAVDSLGNAYVSGVTKSADFPLASPIDAVFQGNYEAFVTKINPSGSAFLYSTFLGGGMEDFGFIIAVDSAGNAYVTGQTKSTDFPLVSPVDAVFQGPFEGFVTKINAAGSALLYSTYLGGGGDDSGNVIAVDSAGAAYVIGTTNSSDFPLSSPVDGTLNDGLVNPSFDAFVTKIGDTVTQDNDSDGIPDTWEMTYFGNLTTANGTTDFDGDGLLDITEYVNGTNPTNPDTDGDGMPDGWEVANLLDPLINDSAVDTDGDGYTNLDEYLGGTNPRDINSVPLVVDPNNPYFVDEGGTIILDGSRSTSQNGTITSYEWDYYNDGIIDAAVVNPVFDASLIDGIALGTVVPVCLTVTDNFGLTGTACTTVTVNNVAPTANAGGPYNGACNTPIQLNGSATDPFPGDLLLATYAWDFNGDGVYGDAADIAVGDPTIPNPTVTFPAAGVYNPVLKVTDDDTDVSTPATTTVTLICPPTADPGGPYTVPEGGSITLNGSLSSDLGGTIFSYEWDYYNDGLIDATGANPVFDATGIDGPTTIPVTLIVTDNDGEIADSFFGIDVTNVAPTAGAGGPHNGTCTTPIQLNGSATDPAPADILTYEWDFNGDGVYGDAADIAIGDPTIQNPTVTYPATGVYTVALRVTDDDTGVSTPATATVTVTCPPTADPNNPYFVDEGASITLNGSGSADLDGTIVLYEWDYYNDGTVDATGVNPVFDASLIDGIALGTVVPVCLTVTDNDGLTGTACTDVNVNNVAPTAGAGGPYTGAPGALITLNGTATDPAPADTYTCAWDLNGNDPTGDDGFFEVVGCNAQISYPAEGVYTVWLQATDDDGGVSVAVSSTVTVSACGPGPKHWTPPAVSSVQMHLTGGLVLDGRAAQACDEVAVFDPAGQLIGAHRVSLASFYGDMVVNGDSSTTPNIDEGALEGDLLTVRVWDHLTQTEYQGGNVRLLTPLPASMVPGYIAYQGPLTFVSNTSTQMNIEMLPGCSAALTAGWNLFGWTCNSAFHDGQAPLPSDYATGSYLTPALMDDALASIGLTPGSYVVVAGPGGKVHVENSPFNNLKTLLPGWSYWVYLNADTTLLLPGSMLAPAETLDLPTPSWYQVAYWGQDGLDPGTAFRCIDGLYDVIADGSGSIYIPGSPFNSLISVNNVDGYFLHTTGPATPTYGCP